MENDKLKSIRVPIDLTVQLAKAAIKDKDAMIELEAELKNAIADALALTSICHKRLSTAWQPECKRF